jgi:hypothetical protein|tara:strand:- start:607 stop:831 length:225 start_codon:yes stop_codon:yes gene_type:complete
MMEKEVTEQKITIDGSEYELDSLSDNAKSQLQGIQVAEAEIKHLNVQIALAQTARNAYVHALQADLPQIDKDDE